MSLLSCLQNELICVLIYPFKNPFPVFFVHYVTTQKYFLPNKNKRKKKMSSLKKKIYELTSTITVIVSYSMWNMVDFLLRKITSQVDFKQNIFFPGKLIKLFK